MGVKRQNNQNKIMKIVTLPVKILGKARDLYVKSMTSCASSASCSHTMSLPNGHLPKSYSVSSSVSSNHDSDDFRDLIRAASVRSMGHKNEIDMLLHEVRQNSKPLPKSCSVGMGGFMGRIDEDKVEEDGSVNGGVKSMAAAEMYPRSKSYAVGKSQVAF
ncbi:hypothetical protein M5689_016841 [Euphorbia peplus]|nr:hypothetical protein M5689_016841 [Euphorbia peplus]